MEIVNAQESHIPEIINLWLEFSEFHEALDHPWYPLKDGAPKGFEAYLRKEMIAAKNIIGYSFWKKHGFEDSSHTLYLKR